MQVAFHSKIVNCKLYQWNIPRNPQNTFHFTKDPILIVSKFPVANGKVFSGSFEQVSHQILVQPFSGCNSNIRQLYKFRKFLFIFKPCRLPPFSVHVVKRDLIALLSVVFLKVLLIIFSSFTVISFVSKKYNDRTKLSNINQNKGVADQSPQTVCAVGECFVRLRDFRQRVSLFPKDRFYSGFLFGCLCYGIWDHLSEQFTFMAGEYEIANAHAKPRQVYRPVNS